MRAKRLAEKKKNEIMTKEEKDKTIHQEVESRKQQQIEFRYRNRVAFNSQLENFTQTINQWAQSGFSPKKLKSTNLTIDQQKPRHASALK